MSLGIYAKRLDLLATLAILVTSSGCNRFPSTEQARKLARNDWENRQAGLYFTWPGGNTIDVGNLTIVRFRDEQTGLPLLPTRNERFADCYNSTIYQEIKANGNPKWASSFIVTNKMLIDALDSARKEIHKNGQTFGNIEIKRVDDERGFLFVCNEVKMQVDERWDDQPFGYESWLCDRNPSVRFFRIGQWVGAFHEDGYVVGVVSR